ncbi:CRISPR-associated endonuclease Cas3'' [Selenomonas sp. AB3002]|uniref:CRISPR-associated endonuclease Cas3'' n=1 Tax=Selenomonas sp. AB3002 TaxID=1392502 RepID=UPI000497BA01
MKYLAHRNQEDGREQLMVDHLWGMSKKAEKFAKVFGEQEVGQLMGLYHDVGKYSREFQEYLLQGGGKKVDHSTAGALELVMKKGIAGILVSTSLQECYQRIIGAMIIASVSVGDITLPSYPLVETGL